MRVEAGKEIRKKVYKTFYNESPETYYLDINSKYPEIERTLSVFHHLSTLELDDICDKFNRLNKNPKDWEYDGEVYGVSKKAGAYLDTLGINIYRTWNTYNGDSDLSQTLQGSNIIINDDEYVLIQIHNGADVRGGYTDAKLFKVTEEHYSMPEYMSMEEIHEDLPYITVLDHEGNEIPKEKLRSILELA